MKKILKALTIPLMFVIGPALAQNTPIDAVSPGPHLFFDAKNIKITNGAEPAVTFDIYMSASQQYVDYITTNGAEYGMQGVDVAYDVDFGTDGTNGTTTTLTNSATVVNSQIATAQAPKTVSSPSPSGYESKFKYSFTRTLLSSPITITPTHIASVKVTYSTGVVIGTVANGAKIQLRCEATNYTPDLYGSKWGDYLNHTNNIIGAVNSRTQALPVTLTMFDANKEASSVNLTWSTTEETNSDRFDVQRSGDGKEWHTIQTVAAKGESKGLVEYAAVDNDPLEGANLYRLHMIDKDGTSAYSRIRNVKFEGVSTYMFPNPVAEELIIKAADWSKVANVKIVGSNGKEVYHSAGKPSPNVDVKNLSNGIYLVHLTNTNGSAATYKIVVNK